MIAAPFAAWLVTGGGAEAGGAAVVGSVILITNSRTLFNELEIDGTARTLGYLAIVAVSLIAVLLAVRGPRKDNDVLKPVPETV